MGPGVFATRRAGTGFRTISPPDPENFAGPPVLNNVGVAAFATAFTDDDVFVNALVMGRRPPFATIADTRGPYGDLGFGPPRSTTPGTSRSTPRSTTSRPAASSPAPGRDRDAVIRTGGTLDGDTVNGVVLCEEGLNNSGQVAFVARLDDPDAPDGSRAVVVRATPQP